MDGSEWTLYVEGKDDQMAIGHLLMRHEYPDSVFKRIKALGDKEKILKAVTVTVRAGTGKLLGFILDANGDLTGTWRSVASRLESVGVAAPSAIPVGGFVGVSKDFRARVGVWIMPDNRRRGALEDFLQDLIQTGDVLLAHAKESTGMAKELGAHFAEKDAKKAVLHAWLAWQERPGCPYGTAIKAHYLKVDSDVARQFVAWLGRVFARPPDS